MVPLLKKILKKIPYFKRKIVDNYQTVVYGRRLPDWSRVPEPLRETAIHNEYFPANPYPVDHIVQEFNAQPFITQQTKIVTMGSCFAQELRKWLDSNQYNCLKNVWGAVFTPQSFGQILQYTFETETWNPKELFWVVDNQYLSPYLKSDILPANMGSTEAEAQAAMHKHYEESAKLLREAEVVVWTLGLTELWRNKTDHIAYFGLPVNEAYDPEICEFYNLTYEDVVRHMRYAIGTLQKNNPSVKIILSVSPVPLHVTFRPELGPYVATQYSKSVLHAAAMFLTEAYDFVFYMPSYEITRSNPGPNYKADGRHVNEKCVDVIMKAFKKLYVLDEYANSKAKIGE